MQGNVKTVCSLKRDLPEYLKDFLNMVKVARFCSLKTNFDLLFSLPHKAMV